MAKVEYKMVQLFANGSWNEVPREDQGGQQQIDRMPRRTHINELADEGWELDSVLTFEPVPLDAPLGLRRSGIVVFRRTSTK